MPNREPPKDSPLPSSAREHYLAERGGYDDRSVEPDGERKTLPATADQPAGGGGDDRDRYASADRGEQERHGSSGYGGEDPELPAPSWSGGEASPGIETDREPDPADPNWHGRYRHASDRNGSGGLGHRGFDRHHDASRETHEVDRQAWVSGETAKSGDGEH